MRTKLKKTKLNFCLVIFGQTKKKRKVQNKNKNDRVQKFGNPSTRCQLKPKQIVFLYLVQQ